jgi:hypothetical protein
MENLGRQVSLVVELVTGSQTAASKCSGFAVDYKTVKTKQFLKDIVKAPFFDTNSSPSSSFKSLFFFMFVSIFFDRPTCIATTATSRMYYSDSITNYAGQLIVTSLTRT